MIWYLYNLHKTKYFVSLVSSSFFSFSFEKYLLSIWSIPGLIKWDGEGSNLVNVWGGQGQHT